MYELVVPVGQLPLPVRRRRRQWGGTAEDPNARNIVFIHGMWLDLV